ncbi:MAG TPA: phosphoglucosamine mutase [Pyrinomonadaceae bacterium]|nr:phosphoglucosamine mutase [Pyrinomonadaceae bacterium]
MQKLFGTDGIRAVAGEFPLDAATVRMIGTSLGRQFAERLGKAPRFVIGRDTRESGTWIEDAIATGASAAGAVCESAGVITTPGVAYLTAKLGFDAGIVISASHNPFQDNGIKVFLPDGRKLDSATERATEADIAAGVEAATIAQESAESSEHLAEYQIEYLDHLRAGVPTLSLLGRKIVIDCANGAASHLAPRLFESLGANVVAIHNEPNGININEDCGSTHIDDLREAVVVHRADLGIAFDGDADRSLFVDEYGELVDGDATLWIIARKLHEQGTLKAEKVIATVMSNIGLEKALSSIDVELVRTDVGDKYVLAELLNSGASVGGEQSGHIIFPEIGLVGDGMMTALLLLDAVGVRTLSEAITGFTQYPQILVNVKVAKKVPFDELADVVAAKDQIEQELHGEGRLLLRYSGTENLARVMIEGKDQSQIEEQAHRLANVIERALREA